MAEELITVNVQNLSAQKQTELDLKIDALIEQNKTNSYEINRLAFDGAMVLTAADKHAKEKASLGFLKRIGRNITGKNNQSQNDINQELASAQYAAQKILVKLAEQQQLSFELISLVHSKLNSEILDLNQEINDIYSIQADTNDRVDSLKHRIAEIDSTLKKISVRIENIGEQVANLDERRKFSDWFNSIEFQEYQGKEYRNLDPETKIVCVVRDFFSFMEKIKPEQTDATLLKSALEKLNLTETFRESFIQRVGTNADLCTHLLGEGSRLGEFTTENEEIIFAIQKASDVDIEGVPYVETPSKAQEFVFEVLYNLRQLALTKEIYDAAEKFFLSGNISEALPLLTELVKNGYVRVRYMLAVIFHKGIGVEKKSDYVKALLSANIFEGDVCSIFFGQRVGFVSKKSTERNFDALKKLADDGNIFAQYELYKYRGNTEYLKLAADKNYFLAAYEFGLLNYLGRGGVTENNDLARKYFEIAAHHEQYKESLFYLGEIYRCGHGVEVDKKKAAEFYKKAYELGISSDESINSIILFYSSENNFAERFKWCQIGAEKNYPMCLSNLGWAYHYGKGVDKNYSEAVKCFERAIAAGNNNGFSEDQLGDIFFEGGHGVEVDKKKAVEFYKKACELGTSSDNSINRIANFYKDVEKNFADAVKWWRIGAEKNYPACLANLGWAYHYGKGVDKNYSEAVKCFERTIAAGESDGFSEEHLGDIYFEGGHGVEVDKKKAVEFYKKACELGTYYDNSINRIANFYDDVEKNISEALKWWRIGAEKNYPLCLANLGWAYHYGKGVTKNYSEAVKCFERTIAAGESDGFSEEHLGDIYFEGGHGVTKDYEKSAEWYAKAVDKDRTLSDETKKNMAEAEYQTGHKYRHGTNRDYKKAATWYHKAYFHGKDCIADVGDCYHFLKKYKKALEFYRRGAEDGNRYCTWKLGTYYRDGNGMDKKDYEQAIAYFLLAIKRGEIDGYCEYQIANILCSGGYGISYDRDTAIKYYRASAEKGWKDARKWLIDHGEAGTLDRIIWSF